MKSKTQYGNISCAGGMCKGESMKEEKREMKMPAKAYKANEMKEAKMMPKGKKMGS